MTIETKDEPSKELTARVEREAGKVSVSVTLDGRDRPLWFAAFGEDLGSQSDFLLPLTLFPAMVSGSRLRLPGEVSPRLLSNVPKIQDVFRLWAEEYWAEEHWDGRLQDVQSIPVDAGVLERCETLPNDLDLEEIANLYQPPPRVLAMQNLRVFERLGTEPELAEARSKLRTCSWGAMVAVC